ncbi:copper chaperone PCu(A)C [Ferrimonas balearica]|uniref:copper chaperone PCu(A)C n=1 Tax=Ferrimonas balearica TaxID=44012 RepID=UPI001C992A9B|nr:copper chaperone PCu(A)C [Ferrimonas balearica]MBY5923427.1 copper chaperone PCu(A)C [Ferrimonas balearica]MBY5995177.1 copper chaperone PCu(A)C [Ferrimonas balearica]
MFKRLFGFFPLLCATSALAAIEIQEPQVRAMPPSVPNTAGYLTITSTDQDDALLGAVCEGVKTTELHTLLQEDGMMKMRPVEAIELAAGEAVALTQGGYHLMMMGLSQPLQEGEQLSCELTFRHADPKTVSLTVTRMGNQDEGHHHHHH